MVNNKLTIPIGIEAPNTLSAAIPADSKILG